MRELAPRSSLPAQPRQRLDCRSRRTNGALCRHTYGDGLIDAHAGGIGSVGVEGSGGATTNLAYVFGTSSCTMTSTEEPVFVPGVWGPYYSAMVPGLWLNEGGQSAAGAAIDTLLTFHLMLGKREKPLTKWVCR